MKESAHEKSQPGSRLLDSDWSNDLHHHDHAYRRVAERIHLKIEQLAEGKELNGKG
jgi:hypothetical protein